MHRPSNNRLPGERIAAEPFAISLKIVCRPFPGQRYSRSIYFVPPLVEPAPPAPELDDEPGMAPVPEDDLDEPVEPAVPLEPEDDVPAGGVADEPVDDASPPSRWPQPVVTNTALNIAIASIDLDFLDIAFIFIPFRDI